VLLPLSKLARQAFVSTVYLRRYSAAGTIFLQGDSGDEMFRIMSGTVRLSVLRTNGRQVAYALLQPGACFGVSSLIDSRCRTHTAMAETDVKLQVLSRHAFNALRAADRAFDEALLRLLASGMGLLDDYLADATSDSLFSRLASQLLEAALPGEVNGLTVHLSQAELGLRIGASRQTVNKILGQFEAEGAISLGYRAITIRDRKVLRNRMMMPDELSAA